MPTDDRTPLEEPNTGEELELTGYVDRLISAAIASRMTKAQVDQTATESVQSLQARGQSAKGDRPAGAAVLEPAGAPAENGESDQTATSARAAEKLVCKPAEPTQPARRQNSPRASMSEGLLALFRSTEPREGPRQAAPSATPRVPDEPQPSPFLKQYFRQARGHSEFAPSGLSGLDQRLGGGFAPGLHVLQGKPGTGKTAFLQSLALEAVSSGRPVRYYALKEGGLGAWERLVSSFSYILGGPALALSTLREQALTPDARKALADIDRVLTETVLTHLSLIEILPPHSDGLSPFVEDVRSGTEVAARKHGGIPLVIVDDLQHLLLLTGVQPLDVMFSHLNDIFVANSIPCLVAVATPDPADRVDGLSMQSLLTLVSTSAPGAIFSHVDVVIETNVATGWTGVVPLLLDRRSGIFA